MLHKKSPRKLLLVDIVHLKVSQKIVYKNLLNTVNRSRLYIYKENSSKIRMLVVYMIFSQKHKKGK